MTRVSPSTSSPSEASATAFGTDERVSDGRSPAQPGPARRRRARSRALCLIVVPSLKSRLIDNRLNDLAHAKRALVAEYQLNAPDFYSNAAASTNARVVLMSVFSQSPSTVVVPRSVVPSRP